MTHRWIAERKFETVVVELKGKSYRVTMKIVTAADGMMYDVSEEYDDAAAIAAETGVAVRDVLRQAEAAARTSIESPLREE